MATFLASYHRKLLEKSIEFSDGDRRTVLLAVLVLLRRHGINNHPCCHDNEDNLDNDHNLRVTEINRYGFVTKVKCGKCDREMETRCYDAKWTYERIYANQELKRGDHVCWHRPYLIWHHAIVTAVQPESITVIHYSSDMKVQENSIPDSETQGCCNEFYRINYRDCYDADYTILRAQKLLAENRYNLLERNCEHFSRWCKTGLTTSSQVGIFWASLGKLAITTGLRLIALVILGFLQFSYEQLEDSIEDELAVVVTTQKNRIRVTVSQKDLGRLEKWLTIPYIVVTTVLFIVYLLKTSGAELKPVRAESHDVENPWACSEVHDRCTRNSCGSWKCCCCCCCGVYSLVCQALSSLAFWKHIQSDPCTCCRRPCNLSCGIFFRIVIRECLATAGTLLVVLNEEWITDAGYMVDKTAAKRTTILIAYATLAHVGGYIVGAVFGRIAEALCSCCCRPKAQPESASEQGRIQDLETGGPRTIEAPLYPQNNQNV